MNQQGGCQLKMNTAEKFPGNKWRNLASDMKRDVYLYLLLFIPLVYYIIFKYIPMYGVTIAFKDYNLFQGIMKSPWVGMDVFKEIWGMPEFFRAVRNTLLLNLLDLVFSFPAPIILAILLNEIRINWFKRTAQTIFYLPYFLSWVIIGGIALQLLSPVTGLINIAIKSLGLPAIPFLTEKSNWILSYLGIGIWQSAGWGTIIYLAAITGINHELYEAAQVDGAGRFRQIWHITLPGLKPTIIILLILNLGRIMMSSFDRPYVIGNNYVKDVSDVISTFVYRNGIQSMRYSLATAVGLFQSMVGMILLLLSNYIANKSGEQGIW
jgi:putative aldouronate transport system permease protein